MSSRYVKLQATALIFSSAGRPRLTSESEITNYICIRLKSYAATNALSSISSHRIIIKKKANRHQ